MRALVVVALAALTVMAVAQGEAKDTERYKLAIDAQELTEGVEGLADLLEKKLSGPARDYYEVLLAKNELYGWVGVLGGILLLLFGVCLIACAFRTEDGVVQASYAIPGIFLVVIGPLIFGLRVGLLLAPEYYAMQEFIETASSFMP